MKDYSTLKIPERLFQVFNHLIPHVKKNKKKQQQITQKHLIVVIFSMYGLG